MPAKPKRVRATIGVLAILAFPDGSRPLNAQTPAAASAVALSVEEAIRRAIETNLLSKLAQATSQEAHGRTLQAAASLLPQLTGTLSQSRILKQNLAALGFSATPLLPDPIIGPYNVFDARFNLVQKLLDVNAIWSTKEAKANEQIAQLQIDLAAEQVAAAAALAYIEDLRAIRGVVDAQSNVQLAERLLTLTQHQHDAGVATAVDLARAETRVSIDHQNLIEANLTAYEADIRLKRVIGAALTDVLTLPNPPKETGGSALEELPALTQASADRVELRITKGQVLAETYGLRAAKAGFLPTISALGDYGFSGNTPKSTARTGSIGGKLDLPIFSGGSTKGQIEEAHGRRSAAQSQYDDTLIQVEEDVRLAIHRVSAQKDDVEATETRKKLAERELTLAQNRYRAGVGDNIQVVTAQATLADALQSWIDARARYANAQVNLAAALGHVRTFHF